MKVLTNIELLGINGGATFAYRAGQACALLWDMCLDGTPYLDTKGGVAAYLDWFG